jgi:OmpA-OmpF porin, OOP family
MKKLITIILLVLSMSFSSFSQTADYPWAIGAGVHWASFSDVSMKLSDQFKDMSWQAGVPDISVSRYLNRFFNVQLTTGYMGLAKTNHHDFEITDSHFWYADLDGQIKFLGGVIKEDAILTPYLYFGFGGQYLNQTGDLKAQAGLGLDLKVVKNLSLYARADYATTTSRTGVAYVHPHVGIKYRFTTKHDMDKDGVVDEDDRCPDVFGLKELKGCPDRDGDGIADIDDKCPDVKGILALQGCPDKDGDGITDAEDRCPEVAGPAALKGCPDRDKDGIADIDDNCPDVAGIAKFKGCPDTDGDGIMDKEDECPTVAGPVALKGCPDRDGDGVADKNDKCPDVFGTVANFGCPEEKTFEYNKLVYFNTAQSTVISKYTKDLDEVVATMKEHSDVGLSVEGHADEQGSDEYNMKLSEKRADYVINYLVKKGIAKERLTKQFFGKTKPAADNTTAEGRSLNRRVEIKTVK